MIEFELGKTGKWIGGHHPCFIVAEIGQNHQGDFKLAKKMIQIAKECGADCVKFQKSHLEEKFTAAALDAPYFGQNSWGLTYGDHKRHLEFSKENYYELKKYADEMNIVFTASGMDHTSVDFLSDELDVPFIKIGSGDANNFPLILHTAQKGKPMVISSGMQTMETMKKISRMIEPINSKFCFLQCTSSYPTKPSDVHLKVIKTFQKEFPNIPIGYSGHELGVGISLAAVALGAKVLERHFTLNKSWKGSDHVASLEPNEFSNLVEQVRAIEAALGGNGTKTFLPCEIPCYEKLGKSVVASRNIRKEEEINADMLCIKVARPMGWKPEEYERLIGKFATRHIKREESITENDVTN